MKSITRNLNIVAILTKNKDQKQIFLSIKLYIWLTHTCKKPFSKIKQFFQYFLLILFLYKCKDKISSVASLIISYSIYCSFPVTKTYYQFEHWLENKKIIYLEIKNLFLRIMYFPDTTYSKSTVETQEYVKFLQSLQ